MTNKGIVVVSFGTSYPDALKRAIEPTEKLFSETFPKFKIYRTFTSKRIRAKIAGRGEIAPLSPEEVFNQLKLDGITQVLVQPLQFVPGEEYRKVKELVNRLSQEKVFDSITMGRTLLHFNGQENKPDDFEEVIGYLNQLMPTLGEAEGMIWMGHGSPEAANVAYELLGYRLRENNKQVFLANVEGGPSIEDILPKLQQSKLTKFHLAPLMWVAGDHALNDMAGEEEDSWKSILKKAGFEVECYLKGLGEWPMMREIFVRRVQEELEKN